MTIIPKNEFQQNKWFREKAPKFLLQSLKMN